MSKKKKPDRSSRAYYQYRQKRTRLVASILAIILALAMFFAYVIEAGLFANLGGAPPEEPAGDAFRILRSAADHSAAVSADNADTAVPDSNEGTGTADAAPSAEEDANNAQAAAELAAEDPVQAAARLAAVGDTEVYEDTLRTILDGRYESGASNEDLVPFTSRLDTRGQTIAQRYANAYDDRQRGMDNGYVPEQILLVQDAAVTGTAGDEDSMREEIPGTMGELTEVVQSGSSLIGVVDLSLEWSVPDAVESFADSGYYAQPDYLYFPQDEEALQEDGDAAAEDAAADTTEDAEDDAPLSEAAAVLSDLNELFDVSPASLPLTDCWDLLAADHRTVRVGVLDTGVYSSHEDLDDVLARDSDGNLLSGDFSTDHIVPGSVSEKDTASHGTHVCGIIAAEANGIGTAGVAAGYSEARDPAITGTTVTPVTELVVVSAYVYSSSGWGFSSLSLTKGLNYLVEQDCRLINMSMGGTKAYDDMTVMGAINNAVARGVLLVVAAGNKEGTTIPPYISYPGFYPDALTVINAETAGKRYSTSNYGPDYDLAAPGRNLYSTTHIAVKDEEGNITGYTDYGTKSGTSMATPVITGIAAMMLYEDPSLSARQIKNILYATAGNQLPEEAQPAPGTVNSTSAYEGSPENRGNELGFGYVDPIAAITAVHQRLDGAQTYADYAELNRTLIEDLEVGQRTTLEYRLLPATATVPETENGTGIVWTSSDDSVATVTDNGIVKAVSDGTCTITGTCPGAGENGSDVSASVTVSINTINLKKAGAVISGLEDKLATGSPIKQDIVVTLEDGTVLEEDTDYIVSYQNNVSPGTATVTVTGKGHYYGSVKDTFTIIPRKGWQLEDGSWHYYKSDGSLLTNGWARANAGWCWMDASGEWTRSKWIKDKGKWYYIKADGYMAANEWAKASKGWCWLDSNGCWVNSRWIKWKGGWYYIKADGYMAANEWTKASKGWCWLGADGCCVTSKWIKWNGSWYYLQSDTYMATGIKRIGGKVYLFDASGKWIR